MGEFSFSSRDQDSRGSGNRCLDAPRISTGERAPSGVWESYEEGAREEFIFLLREERRKEEGEESESVCLIKEICNEYARRSC